MGVKVDDESVTNLEIANLGIYFIAVFLFPAFCIAVCLVALPIMGCMLCLCPTNFEPFVRCMTWIFCFLDGDRDKKEKKHYIAVYGHRAPECYSCYLLYILLVMSAHAILSFIGNAVVVTPKAYNEDCDGNFLYYENYSLSFSYSNDDYCLVVHVFDGLSAIATIFGISAIVMAFTTWVLLSCCTEMTPKKNSQTICGCKTKVKSSRKCCLHATLMIPIHLLGLLAPRALFYWYVFTYSDTVSVKPVIQREQYINPGPIDVYSQYIIVAVCDALSLSFLTPWIYFSKKNNENEDGDSSYPVTTDLEQNTQCQSELPVSKP